MEDKELEKILQSWDHQPTLDSDIHQKVRDRIHNDYFSHSNVKEENDNFFGWLTSFISHPVYATVFLFVIVGITWGISSSNPFTSVPHSDDEIRTIYRQIIDPANSVKEQIKKTNNFQTITQNAPVSKEKLTKALHFIEDKVDLNHKQSAQFERIHQKFFTESESLYVSLIGLENEYREFERKRISGEEINFFKVYHNLNSQKEIYKQALQEQQKFITEVFQILNSEQKGKYGELFLTHIPNTTPSAFILNPNSDWQI